MGWLTELFRRHGKLGPGRHARRPEPTDEAQKPAPEVVPPAGPNPAAPRRRLLPAPGKSFELGNPQEEGFDGPKVLAVARELGDGLIMRHGRIVVLAGDPHEVQTNLASCTRFLVVQAVNVRALTLGHLRSEWLEWAVNNLPSATARKFPDGYTLKMLFAYIRPDGKWQYSGGEVRGVGKPWLLWPVIFRELMAAQGVGENFSIHEYFNIHVRPELGGHLVAEKSSDGTPRIRCSMVDGCRVIAAFMDDGAGIFDPALVRRATSGGPDGDGRPYECEGWGGVHLIRNGAAWEMPNMRGVPDGYMARSGGKSQDCFIGIPSLDLIVASKVTGTERKPAPAPDAWLPQIVASIYV